MSESLFMPRAWLYFFWFSTYTELNVEREKKVAKQYIREEIFKGVNLSITVLGPITDQ